MELKSDEHDIATPKQDDGALPKNTLKSVLTSRDLGFDSMYDNDLRYDYDAIGEYYFESARLAYKTDPNYKNLVQAIVLLEAGHEQAQKNVATLSMHCKRAATSPLHYVEKIESNEGFGITRTHKVGFIPDIAKHIASSDCNFSEEYMNANSSAADELCLERSYALLKAHKPWTQEEQSRLEGLLMLYPPEETESRRWEKIAAALGTRTANQVASRVQKYFIKLQRAGVPIPGCQPNPKSIAKNSRSAESHGKASVPSNNGEDENSRTSIATSADGESLSDEDIEGINPILKNTPEYQELLLVKKVLQQKLNAAKLRNAHKGI